MPLPHQPHFIQSLLSRQGRRCELGISMTQALRAAASRLEHWIKNDALPLWLARGIEPSTKANYERLTPAGVADLESTTRVRVQARQAFFKKFARVCAKNGDPSNGWWRLHPSAQ